MFAPRAGRPLVIILAILVLLSALVALGVLPHPWYTIAGLAVGTAVWLFLATFFRDPERTPGAGVVSAADGRVRAVEREGDRWRISVFMNVTNVHVNRLPVDARFESIDDAGRGYRPAYRPDAERNVRRAYRLGTAYGPVEVVQITGVVARRLVSFVRPGAEGKKGDRFGMIVLGSRVDVVLPAGRLTPAVSVGDRVHAGSSTIAREAT
ncbi:MAG TPA: phosphatidylserine decarboxylase [Thermoplasmata archaeon]|nr:phosphatidylserine decarboxylase [Thermoplasmata archaeon]